MGMSKTISNSFLLGVALLLTLSAGIGNAQQMRLLDRIVAIVEDDVILQSELNERMAQIRANMERAEERPPPAEQMRRDVLDLLIVESLQLQMAERAGVRISDDQLNAAMARIAQQNGLTLEQFQGYLDQGPTSYQQAREQIRREMILQQVQQGNISQRIQVTDQEMRSYLASDEGRARTAPEFRLGHILVEVSSEASADEVAEARRRAADLANAIRNGRDYQEVARSAGLKGTDLDWRRQAEIPEIFADTVTKLEDREVADPIRSASGWHVIQVLDTRGRRKFVTEAKARHILLKPSAIRSEQQTEALARALRQRVKNGESFHELAKEYSEDIGSAQEGGELGWVTPGQMVPEFEEVVKATAENDISQPFKSRYGWHIVMVEDRRKTDITERLHRNLARNTIHQRKFGEELDIWLRKIRDEAYVDIK